MEKNILSNDASVFRAYTDDETFSNICHPGTMPRLWRRCLDKYAERIAIIDGAREYTFLDLENDAARLRTLLHEGRAAGDSSRIGLCLQNSYDFVRLFIAAVTSGCTVVILPAQLEAPAVEACSKKFNLDLVITQENLGALCEELPSAAPSGMTDCEPSAPCVALFTGGTTGKSKAALLSHEALIQGVVNGCYGYSDVFFQRYILTLPLSHVFGLVRNLLTSLYTGSTLFICRSTKDMFRDIAAFRPTILITVPAIADMALALSEKLGRSMLGDELRYIICGAAPVSQYLVTKYDAMGISLFPGYGLTESANLVSGNPEPLKKPGSVGIPYPNQELRIVDGELWLRGKNLMLSYLGAEESFTDGWFRTGDLARFDDDGFLYITGRTKEVIVLPTGENISPAELEEKFNGLAFVQDSQVFEDITENGRHILALEVFPRAFEVEGSEGLTKSAMMDQLNEVNKALPPFARVSRIVIRETDFQRTPAMKIVRYSHAGKKSTDT